MYLLKKYQKYLWFIFITLLISFPLFSKNLFIGHDTLFHLSRIEGLATSIKHGDLIPTIYPFKNAYYGYSSALFYCDILLYPFALLYLLNVDLAICYKLCVLFYTFIAAITSYNFIYKVSNNKYAGYLASLLYITATYRLSNVYVRGALGEIISYAFLPIVLLGIYKLFYSNEDGKKEIIIGFSLLILSHNISFILACVLFLIFIIINIKKLKNVLIDIIKSIGIVVVLTAFFTFPMLEQMFSQEFYIGKGPIDFYETDLTIYQLFVNKLNYNSASKQIDGLTLNPGICLFLLSLSNFFIKHNKFVRDCLLISFICLVIVLGIIPLKLLSILSTIQFIWRFMMLVCVLLLAPATVSIFEKFKNSLIPFALIAVFVLVNTLYVMIPCLSNTGGIANETKYSQLIDGSMFNLYHNVFYVRVELACGDYLPVDGINYETYKYGLYDGNYKYIGNPIIKDYEISFNIDKPNSMIIVPKTYYKGYSVYNITGNEIIELPTYQDEKTKLVAFDTLNTSGQYVVKYKHTLIQNISYFVTLISTIILIIKKVNEYIRENKNNISSNERYA